jgi:hypothetical protein
MSVKLVLVFTFCLIVQSGTAMQRKSPGQAVRRDRVNYDKAGPFEFDNDLHPRDADRLLGEIRDFLWKHWKDRQPGLVTATFYTIEGDPTKSLYFVESDARGRWLIRVNSDSTISALLPKGKRPRRIIVQDDFDKVDRVEPTSTSSPNSIAIPNDAIRLPQTFKLRLRNSRTNSVRIF